MSSQSQETFSVLDVKWMLHLSTLMAWSRVLSLVTSCRLWFHSWTRWQEWRSTCYLINLAKQRFKQENQLHHHIKAKNHRQYWLHLGKWLWLAVRYIQLIVVAGFSFFHSFFFLFDVAGETTAFLLNGLTHSLEIFVDQLNNATHSCSERFHLPVSSSFALNTIHIKSKFPGTLGQKKCRTWSVMLVVIYITLENESWYTSMYTFRHNWVHQLLTQQIADHRVSRLSHNLLAYHDNGRSIAGQLVLIVHFMERQWNCFNSPEFSSVIKMLIFQPETSTDLTFRLILCLICS